MRYWNCPACHLTLPDKLGSHEECPRCRKRDDMQMPMFLSPLPYRLLAGPLLPGSSTGLDRDPRIAGFVETNERSS
jgi:hypothetical protein